MTVASVVTAIEHWFQTEYIPRGAPWYNGAVWGNVFVVPVAFVLASVFWPRFRRAVHRFVDHKLDPIHEKIDQHHAEHMAELAAHGAKIDTIYASVTAKPRAPRKPSA